MRNISKFFSTSKLQMFISTIGIIALVAFSSVIVLEALKTTVVINDNGEEQTVQTHAKTVGEVLDQNDITVNAHDELSHDLNADVEGGMTIDYKTANEVTVTVNGEKNTYYTTLDTVEDFLIDHNLNVTNRDELSHDLGDKIEEGMHLDINKAFQVTLVNGGKKEKLWTTGGTVKQFLNDNQVNYSKNSNDKLNLKLNDELDENTKIKIVRVDIKEKEIEEKVPFETEKQEDDTLEEGQEKVISEGKEGLNVKTYEITNEDGKKSSEKLINTEVQKKQKNKVVAVGTKKATTAKKSDRNLQTLASKESSSKESSNKEPSNKDTSNKKDEKSDASVTNTSTKEESSSQSSEKTMTMNASAYTASCSGCSGHTATGIDLNANPNMKVIAVDPNVIPLGSKVWVEGYGEAIAGDTGGAIKGNRIDLHFPSKDAAYAFGQRTVTVKVLQ